MASDLRQAVSDLAPVLAGVSFPRGALSISIGVAGLDPRESILRRTTNHRNAVGESLFKAADRALYDAKQRRANRASVAAMMRSPPGKPDVPSYESMNHVLVTGATGQIGREVVSQLRAAGCPVRAMSRNPGAGALPSDVELVRGDLLAPETLDGCLDGIERVFLVWTTALGRCACH